MTAVQEAVKRCGGELVLALSNENFLIRKAVLHLTALQDYLSCPELQMCSAYIQ